MASFASANLDHELMDKFVMFKLSTKLRFEPEEVGKQWLLQIEFWEKDPLKDDQLFPVPESVRFGEVDAGKIEPKPFWSTATAQFFWPRLYQYCF